MKVRYKGELTNAILDTVGPRPFGPGHGNKTATDVARGICHSPAVVSGILARLHKQGRVARRNHPDCPHGVLYFGATTERYPVPERFRSEPAQPAAAE